MADAVVAAKAGQKTPDRHYNVERMLKRVSLCGDCRTFVVWREGKIPRDDHPYRKAWADRQSWLHIEVRADDLLAGLIKALCAAAAQRLNERAFINSI